MDSILSSIKANDLRTSKLIKEEEIFTNTNDSEFSEAEQKITMPTILNRLNTEEEEFKRIIFHTTPVNKELSPSNFRKIHVNTNNTHFKKEIVNMHQMN